MDAIDMYFLNRIQPDLAADAEGCLPNDRFWERQRGRLNGLRPCCKSTLF
jgi:hypothetical protein